MVQLEMLFDECRVLVHLYVLSREFIQNRQRLLTHGLEKAHAVSKPLLQTAHEGQRRGRFADVLPRCGDLCWCCLLGVIKNRMSKAVLYSALLL